MNAHQTVFSIIPFILRPAFHSDYFCIFLPRGSSTLSTQFSIPFRISNAYLPSHQKKYIPSMFWQPFCIYFKHKGITNNDSSINI